MSKPRIVIYHGDNEVIDLPDLEGFLLVTKSEGGAYGNCTAPNRLGAAVLLAGAITATAHQFDEGVVGAAVEVRSLLEVIVQTPAPETDSRVN